MMAFDIIRIRHSLDCTTYHFPPSLIYPKKVKEGLHSKQKLLSLSSIIALGIGVENTLVFKGSLLITIVKSFMKQGPVQSQDDRF
jgi:hypothetical protein